MKCKECGGSGWIQDILTDEVWECDKCNGKGVVEPLTEQEYIQTCNTEQLAEVFADVSLWIHLFMKQRKRFQLLKKQFYDWLKQPHTPKE